MSSQQKKKHPPYFRAMLALLKPFKSLTLFVLFFMIVSSFLESFGIAMLYPLFDLILGQDSDSQLSQMLNLPLEVMGAQNNVVIISSLFISIIIIKIICVVLTMYLSNKLCFDI